MTDSIFTHTYAREYDRIYQNKDYAAECDFLEALFKKHALSVRSILDLGCGTGGHLIPLIKRGYSVTGVDLSTAMLRQAMQKLNDAGLSAPLIESDMCSVDLSGTFDVVISMFSSMCYHISNERFGAACRAARKHLSPGGAFIFDIWYGPGILHDRPKDKTRRHTVDGLNITRSAQISLNEKNHTVNIAFTLSEEKDAIIISEYTENHRIRYFFTEELSQFLSAAGFSDTVFCPFLNAQSPTLPNDLWYLTVIGLTDSTSYNDSNQWHQ
jgi:SAM-dependent methyltransferase